MGDRPVCSPNWTAAEIVGKIDPNAESISFGVMNQGKGKVWVSAVSVEVVPDNTPQTSRQ